MKLKFLLAVLFLFACTSTHAQDVISMGYMYPAGVGQGNKALVTIGGQNLRGATDVHISGKGVTAKIIHHSRPLINLNKEQSQYLRSRLQIVWDKRLSEKFGVDFAKDIKKKFFLKKDKMMMEMMQEMQQVPEGEQPTMTMESLKIPPHPLFYKLEDKSLRELTHLTHMLFLSRRYRQPNRQIGELLLVEITADKDAIAGSRQLRIQTKRGLTNAMTFQVGQYPEVIELEPNNREASPDIPTLPKGTFKIQPLTLPITVNGQVMPGDVDRFSFTAKKGQKLVLQAHARELVPYLADAVPGWFQATLTVYNDKGKEVAFADDYRFDPDPAIFFDVPDDGIFEIKIHDAIYRGREDFVYRITIAESPFITSIFPLGGRLGIESKVQVSGHHLPAKFVTLDTSAPSARIRKLSLPGSNSAPYVVHDLPSQLEKEPNNILSKAQPIILPMLVDGRITSSNDKDSFSFDAEKDQVIVAEVFARRLQSPLDSLVRLMDSKGKVIAWNDDYVEKDKFLHKDLSGLVTHHADSYLMTKLPSKGRYYIQISDTQQHGSLAHAYRLRISKPRPSVALRMTPSSMYFSDYGIIPVDVHVLRSDGFLGEVKISLNDTSGFILKGATVPYGVNRITMSLQAPRKKLKRGRPVADPEAFEAGELSFVGTFMRDGKTVTRPVLPADDVMQAFLFRHLVSAPQSLAVLRKFKWKRPEIKLLNKSRVILLIGESTVLKFKTSRHKYLKELAPELANPPKGITLEKFELTKDGFDITIKSALESPSQVSGNLIFNLFREFMPKAKKGNPAPKKRKVYIGVAPAVPYARFHRPQF